MSLKAFFVTGITAVIFIAALNRVPATRQLINGA